MDRTKKSDSVKRKLTELNLEDNNEQPSGSKSPSSKRATGAIQTPEKMANPNVKKVLAPPKFVAPTSNDLQDAIRSVTGGDEGDIDGAVGGISTFTAKVKKPRIDYPFALYILAHTDTEERKNLTKPHYVEFEKFLFNTVCNRAVEDNLKISIDFTIFRGTYGLVAAVDENSSRWVKTQTKAFKYEALATRAYNRWENEQAWIFSVFLSGEMFKQQNCRPNWVTAKILDINQLKGDFTNASLDKKSNKDGAYLSFEAVSEDLIEKLNSKTRLNCILSNPLLHKRLRKQRSKEEFLELFNSTKKGASEGDKPPN